MTDVLKIAGGVIIAAAVLFFGSAILAGISDGMSKRNARLAAEDACFEEIGSNLSLEYQYCVELRVQ